MLFAVLHPFNSNPDNDDSTSDSTSTPYSKSTIYTITNKTNYKPSFKTKFLIPETKIPCKDLLTSTPLTNLSPLYPTMSNPQAHIFDSFPPSNYNLHTYHHNNHSPPRHSHLPIFEFACVYA